MAKNPPSNPLKITLLGLLIILVISVFFVFFAKWQKQYTLVTLNTFEEKFRVNFNIPESDQEEFSKILQKLQLPQSIKEGFEFKLDATSAAALSFTLPLEAKITSLDPKIAFKGSVHRSGMDNFPLISLKIPQTTNLAVFAPDFRDFMDTRLNLAPEFKSWLDTNLFSEKGQILIIFGKDADFAVVAKPNQVDFESLKNIQTPDSEEPSYKKSQSEEAIDLHLINLPPDWRGNQLTATLFQLGQWLFFSSSPQAAQELIRIQKSQKPSIDFLPLPASDTISLAILFRNSDQDSIGEPFQKLIFGQTNEFAKTIKKIAQAQFTLNENEFSGLINLK
jgi:hypothetical protein